MPQTLTALLLLAAQPAASPAEAPPRAGATVLMPEAAERRRVFEEWGLAEAVAHGDRIYLSGVVAALRPGETDPAVAIERAFREIGRTLARAGSGWDQVLEITSYHVDVATQMDAFRSVKDRYVRSPFPAWTAIDIDRLVPPTGLVEIRVTAARRR